MSVRVFNIQVPVYEVQPGGRWPAATGAWEHRDVEVTISELALATELARACAVSLHGRAKRCSGLISAKFLPRKSG